MLSPTERLATLAATVAANRWIPYEPTERQARFLTDDRFEVLYGGAAGGGKSIAALMAAAQYVTQPGYAALILRRTYPQLSQAGGLIPESLKWWQGTAAKWNGTEKVWRFPSGATIAFGHLQHEVSKYDYQSGEYHFVAFEELTQFTESQYTYLFSRVRRRTDAPFPVRVRATSNPGGSGHRWVKGRFIDAPESERGFVPALLDDNPHLDRDEYERRLLELDPVTRAQLRDGDWTAAPDGQYVFPNVEVRRITDEEVDGFDHVYNGLDFGWFPDPSHFIRCAYDSARRTVYIFAEHVAIRTPITDLAESIRGMLGEALDDAGKVAAQARREMVVCDSAEPRSIAGLRECGIDARAVVKGKDSVGFRMRWLSGRDRIVIDPHRCPVAASEFGGYEFEQDGRGEYVNGYPDKDNHGIDATCYGLSPVIFRRGS